jgi:TonB-linked SusC/RagA family outer membrane protein
MTKTFKKKGFILMMAAVWWCFSGNTRAEVTPVGHNASVSQQSGKITGTVSDDLGPVAGAFVAVKGTSNGTITDADGRFTLNGVKNGAIIQITYIGYITQEITCKGQTSLSVVLEENIKALDEVVVEIGYGQQKKASLTGSVATLNVDEIRSIPAGNLSNTLAGRLSGVTVTNTGGGVPGSSANIVVRSRGTWNSVDPLYVIDGVACDKLDFDMLNANDIENFSILKDASAASVYGARAANGVVLVTTKRGKASKPVISYSGSVSAGEVAYEPERETVAQRIRLASIGQFEYRNVLGGGRSIDEYGYHPAYSSIYKNGVDASGGYIAESGSGRVFSDEARAYYSDPAHQYDRLKEVYRTPVTASHSLNVRGGSEAIKYYMGANYYNETGIFKAASYEKYSVRSNIDATISRQWMLSLALNIDNSEATTPTGQDARMSNVYRFLNRSSPLSPGIVDGKYIGGIGEASAGDSYAAIANGDAGLTKDQYWNAAYTAVVQWTAPWIKGLTARLQYNSYVRNRLQKEQAIPYQSWLLVNTPAVTGDPLGMIYLPQVVESSVLTRGENKLVQTNAMNKRYQLNGIINYSNTFGKHEVGAMLTYEQTESYSEDLTSTRYNFETFSRPYLSFGSSDRSLWSSEGEGRENGRISYAGRFTYAFDSRYLAEFSFREDLSSNFDPRHRRGFFPSGSLAWRLSEEGFFRNSMPFINNLKLRGSVGLTGNDAVSAFQWLDRIDVNGAGMYYGGGNTTKGIAFSSVANPLITWEKSLSYNGGIDLGVLNMFTLEANYFFRKTYDILGAQTAVIPDTFGADLSASNYGKVNSFGFELELGYNRRINRNLTLWSKGTFGWSDNELIEYAEPEGIKPWLSRRGKNWDRQYGTITDGIVQQMYKIGEQNDRGEDLYRVVTSTGNTYIIPYNYYRNASDRYVNNGHYNSLRPGWIFYRDLRGQDADGNPTAPDGYAEDTSDFDKDWTIDHLYPPCNYSLLLGGKWKGISLEVFLQGTAGNQKAAMVHNGADTYWNGTTWGYWAADSYSVVDNPDGAYPMLVNGPGGGTGANHFWIRDASFVRLKNVTLSYDLPKKALARVGVSSARVYVTGYNLALLWSNMKFHDPELGEQLNDDGSSKYNSPNWSPNSQESPNNGVATYPLMRTVTFGLNFSF